MPGKLIYLMGPSGSGKDSLIDAVRPYLPERGCEVIRRVITRSSEAVGEDAQSHRVLRLRRVAVTEQCPQRGLTGP